MKATICSFYDNTSLRVQLNREKNDENLPAGRQGLRRNQSPTGVTEAGIIITFLQLKACYTNIIGPGMTIRRMDSQR